MVKVTHYFPRRSYFYRDKEQKEIDLLIEQDNMEQNNMLYPVEIKKSTMPSLGITNNFSVLAKLKQPIGHGAVLCLRQKDIPLSADVDAIPIGYL